VGAADRVDLVQDDARIAARFLRSVFGGQEEGFVALFQKPSKHSTFVPLNREGWYTDAAKSAMLSRDKENVYFAIGVQGQQPHRGRGKQAGVIALPGLWADIDVLGPNHAATNLPPTLEDAWKIIQVVPFKPTVVVFQPLAAANSEAPKPTKARKAGKPVKPAKAAKVSKKAHAKSLGKSRKAAASPKGPKKPTAKGEPREGSKKAEIIALMQRAKGVSLPEIQKLTGWQKHTVRGFISILGSKGGLKIDSEKNTAGERVYRIA